MGDNKINWDLYDFDKIEKEVKEKMSKEKENKYLKIVKKIIKEMIGNSSVITVELNKRDIGDFISILISRSVTGCRFDFNGDKFLLYGHDGAYKQTRNYEPGLSFEFDDENLFESIVRQSVEKILIPEIKNRHKKGYLKTLPSKIDSEKVNIDLKKLTSNWLIKKFHDISSEIMNGETIENVDIQIKNNKLICSFDVDCNRYGLFRNGGLISINKHGFIKVDLDDTPVEGCGIENELSEEIEKLITI
jgi:hypothetical protein